jgi:hypothetical protein
MAYRRPVTDPAGEVRLAQIAAERHPEVSLPDVPEGFGSHYAPRLPAGAGHDLGAAPQFGA